jgi:hypothetical protein
MRICKRYIINKRIRKLEAAMHEYLFNSKEMHKAESTARAIARIIRKHGSFQK